MQCFACNTENGGGIMYCTKCGVKLDMTADEIQQYYAQQVKDDRRDSAEFHARRLLYFSVFLLIIAITFFVVAGTAPENTSYIPSATKGTRYIEMNYEVRPEFPELYIPESAKR